MASQATSPTTNSDGNMAPPYYQHLLFSPAGRDREKYDPKEYRALLTRHLHDRAKKAKKSQRPPDAGQARAANGGEAS